jgi:serralysin
MRLFTNLLDDSATSGTADAAAALLAPLFACGCPVCAGGGAATPQAGATPGQPAAPLGSGIGSFADAAALASGTQWSGRDASGKTVVTYSFSTATSAFGSDSAQFSASLLEFSAQDKATTRALLATISAVCNVTFVEVADSGAQFGQVRYAYSQAPNDMGYSGYAFFPSDAAIGGDVWIGTAQAAAQWDFYRPDLILHETLHAIGLKHPFSGGVTLGAQADIIPNTVMSYSPVAGSNQGSLSLYPVEPMALDVQMLQNLYGAAANNAGNTVYDLADAAFRNFRALWDSAGTDTLDASRVGNGVTLDLNAGARSDIGVKIGSYAIINGAPSYGSYTSTLALANGTRIENAMGSAFGDTLLGNEFDNIFVGAGGDDRIDGSWGTDSAVYSGTIANFKIEKIGGAVYVTDRQSGQGTDILTGIEKLRFQDMNVDLTVQDVAAAVSGARLQAVVELYVGFFNRVPDAEGLNFWLNQMNQGMTTAKVADAFYTAALQFSSLTGYTSAMTNEDFVKVIYKNVLGRSNVDAEGLGYWSDALAHGTETRGSLLEAILDSAHTFEGNAQYGWVADLLSNKYEVGKLFAVDMGLTFNTSEQSISRGMEIAAAVTPTDTDAAVQLIGVATHDLSLAA